MWGKTAWFNTKSQQPMYGIKIKRDGRWWNVAENNEPLLFDTEEARDKKLAELKESGIPKH